MNNKNPSAESLNNTKLDALDLIKDIKDVQALFSKLLLRAVEQDINIIRKDDESQVELLTRIADQACELERLAIQRELSRPRDLFHTDNRAPRSLVGRTLSKLANIAG